MRPVALLILGGLVACAPDPRATSFFAAHPKEAERVVAACARGDHRGAECEHALAGLAAIQQDARIEAFRKGFAED